MKRWIAAYLLFQVALHAQVYNPFILQAEASIFPKILLLQKNISMPHRKKMRFSVIYRQSDRAAAQELQRYIESNYGDQSDLLHLEVLLVEQARIVPGMETDAIMVLHLEAETLKMVAALAQEMGVPTFAYSIDQLRYDLLFSLSVEKKVNIYLNNSVLKAYNISFDKILYRMTKFIDE